MMLLVNRSLSALFSAYTLFLFFFNCMILMFAVDLLQDLRKRFPGCSSDMEPGQCFFPQEVAKGITTPMFILNPAYDVWQVEHVLTPDGSDPQNLWQDCRMDITKCNTKQLEILQGCNMINS
jgi:hypothetical protein